MYNLKKAKLRETDSRLVLARGWGAGEMVLVKDYKLPVLRFISSRNLVDRMMTIVNSTKVVYLKIIKKIDLKYSDHQKKVICETMNVLTNFLVAIILPYIQRSNQHVVHLKLPNGICQLYMNKVGKIQDFSH